MQVFSKSKQLEVLSAGLGLALFLAMVESIIPKPIPFFRIGIANIPLVILVPKLDFKNYIFLAFMKVFGGAILTGTIFSPIFLIAFCGTMVSALIMFALSRLFKDKISYLGLSISGAFFSDIVRILVASLVLGNVYVFMVAPFVLFSGIVTSIIIGLFSHSFMKFNDFENISFRDFDSFRGERSKKNDLIFLFLAILAVLAFALQNSVIILFVEYLSVIIVSLVFKKRVKIIMPLFLIIFVTIFELIVPQGEILFNIGTFNITKLSLLSGLRKSFHFCGLIVISSLYIKNNIDIGNSINPVIRNGFFSFNKLLELKIDKKSFLKFNYIDYLNSADLKIRDIRIKRSFSVYIIISTIFLALFVFSIFVNPDQILL